MIGRCKPVLPGSEGCALPGHGRALRILAATWLGLPPPGGRFFVLHAGGLSLLGFERERRVLPAWSQRSA